MGTPTVILTSYNTGFDAESDFDAWTQYVADHIKEHVGFAVQVMAGAFSRPEFQDEVSDATDEQEAAIREAVSHSLWDEGCCSNFGQPVQS